MRRAQAERHEAPRTVGWKLLRSRLTTADLWLSSSSSREAFDLKRGGCWRGRARSARAVARRHARQPSSRSEARTRARAGELDGRAHLGGPRAVARAARRSTLRPRSASHGAAPPAEAAGSPADRVLTDAARLRRRAAATAPPRRQSAATGRLRDTHREDPGLRRVAIRAKHSLDSCRTDRREATRKETLGPVEITADAGKAGARACAPREANTQAGTKGSAQAGRLGARGRGDGTGVTVVPRRHVHRPLVGQSERGATPRTRSARASALGAARGPGLPRRCFRSGLRLGDAPGGP